MTTYKVYRISINGYVTIDIVRAHGWDSLLSQCQYMGDPIFKIEVYGGEDPQELP